MSQSNIPKEYFDRLFTTLVGTPEAGFAFEGRLESAVVDAQYAGKDPYDALEEDVEHNIAHVVENAVMDGLLSLDSFTSRDGIDSVVYWRSIRRNAGIGMELVVAAPRAVGSVYATEAREPQDEQLVRRSAHGVVKHVTSMAFMDRGTAKPNVTALEGGINPRSAVDGPILLRDRAKGWKASLYAREAPPGQILAVPRFKLRRPPEGNQNKCPATESRIKLAEEEEYSSLVRLTGRMTDVAVRAIYPRQFAIKSC